MHRGLQANEYSSYIREGHYVEGMDTAKLPKIIMLYV